MSVRARGLHAIMREVEIRVESYTKSDQLDAISYFR